MKVPALLLATLYLAALAVALRDPSEHLLAGCAVLAAVLWRLPATRSALSHVAALRPSPARRSRRTATSPAVAPATPS